MVHLSIKTIVEVKAIETLWAQEKLLPSYLHRITQIQGLSQIMVIARDTFFLNDTSVWQVNI